MHKHTHTHAYNCNISLLAHKRALKSSLEHMHSPCALLVS